MTTSIRLIFAIIHLKPMPKPLTVFSALLIVEPRAWPTLRALLPINTPDDPEELAHAFVALPNADCLGLMSIIWIGCGDDNRVSAPIFQPFSELGAPFADSTLGIGNVSAMAFGPEGRLFVCNYKGADGKLWGEILVFEIRTPMDVPTPPGFSRRDWISRRDWPSWTLTSTSRNWDPWYAWWTWTVIIGPTRRP